MKHLIFMTLMTCQIPQIPFSVYDHKYKKTVKVVASCEDNKNSVVLFFDPQFARIECAILAAVDIVFDMPGVTKVNICRRESSI